MSVPVPSVVAVELRLPIEQAEALERLLQYVEPLLTAHAVTHFERDRDLLLPAIATLLARLAERAVPFD